MEEGTDEQEVKYVGTQEALAAQLGVERKTIQRWQKRTDCPGRGENGFDVVAWKAFVAKNKLGRKPNKSKWSLEEEKLALGNERQRLMNEKLRGGLASVDECVKVISNMVSGFTLSLTQIEATIAEEVVGVDVGEAIKRLRRRHREVLEHLALGEWAEKKTFWSKVRAELSNHLETPDHGNGLRNM